MHLFPPSSTELISSLEEVKLKISRKPTPVFLEEAYSLLPSSSRKLINLLLEEVKRNTSRKLILFLLEEANSLVLSSLKEVVSISPQRNWLPSSSLIGGTDSLPLWRRKTCPTHSLSYNLCSRKWPSVSRPSVYLYSTPWYSGTGAPWRSACLHMASFMDLGLTS